MWEELDAYMPEPTCGCPLKCVCVSGILLAKKHHEMSKTIRFLTGLHENFAMTRSQILLMDPLPSINRIFSMVIQHERQFASSENTKILVANTDARRASSTFGKGRGGYSNTYGSKNSS